MTAHRHAIRRPDVGFSVRSAVCSAGISGAGDYLAVVGRSVSLWTVRGRKRLHSTSVLIHPSSVTFSLSADNYIIKNTAGQFAVCRTASGECIDTYSPPEHDEGSDVLVAPDGVVIDGSWNGEIRRRTVANLTPEVVWRGEHRMVTDISFSSGTCAFLASAKHSHPQFNTPDGADVVLLCESGDWSALTVLPRTWKFLRSVVLSPDGTRLALRHGAKDAFIEIVDRMSGTTIAVTEDQPGGTGCDLAWSADSRYLIAVCKQRFVLRDALSLVEAGDLPSPYPSCVVPSGEGQMVFLGDWERGRLWSWPVLLQTMTGDADQQRVD